MLYRQPLEKVLLASKIAQKSVHLQLWGRLFDKLVTRIACASTKAKSQRMQIAKRMQQWLLVRKTGIALIISTGTVRGTGNEFRILMLHANNLHKNYYITFLYQTKEHMKHITTGEEPAAHLSRGKEAVPKRVPPTQVRRIVAKQNSGVRLEQGLFRAPALGHTTKQSRSDAGEGELHPAGCHSSPVAICICTDHGDETGKQGWQDNTLPAGGRGKDVEDQYHGKQRGKFRGGYRKRPTRQ